MSKKILIDQLSKGYGPSGKDSYKRYEDQRGGRAEQAAYDVEENAYTRRRKLMSRSPGTTKSYTKGRGRPD